MNAGSISINFMEDSTMRRLVRFHVGASSLSTEQRERVLRVLSTDFGGVTVHDTQGGWIAKSGDLVVEAGLEIQIAIQSDRLGEAQHAVEQLFPGECAFGVEWRGDYFVVSRGERIR